MGKRSRRVKESQRRSVKVEAEAIRPLEKRTLLVLVILIVAIGFGVYSNSLSGKFLWDDDLLIKDNTYIKSWANIPKIFTGNTAAGALVKLPSYRPMQILTYTLDYSLWKLDPFGYHLTGILFHIMAALSVFWLINILFRDALLSCFTSILFVVHPVHAGAVSYISGMADPMALLFTLLTLIFYIRYDAKKEIRSYIPMLLCYALALLSRENSLLVPALILLYHYTFKKKFALGSILPVLAITGAYVLLRLTVLRSILFHEACDASLFQRIPGSFASLASYIRLLFLPLGLHMEYGYRQFYFNDPAVLSGIAALSLLLFLIHKAGSKNTLVFFSLVWFLLGLLPVSNLYPINAYMAEHWLYLPSIGFFLLLSAFLCNIYRREKFKIAGIVLISCAILFYSILTVKQNDYWKEPAAFYERTLKYLEYNYRILNNLAKIYEEEGRYQNAFALYDKAITAEPKSADAYFNLGNAYRNSGDKEKAIATYRKTIELDPGYFRAYNNLGSVYTSLGKYEDAIPAFSKTVEMIPDFWQASYNLGLSYLNTGRYPEAIASFRKALETNPKSADVAYSLAGAYYYGKEYGMAVKYCDQAMELGRKVSPEFLQALEPYRK